ncbi:MAG: LytTR family transcriptional regulator [Clostridia bacterium]|nr:LytTR family transcriptional regulator [Clostridia bacterium]
MKYLSGWDLFFNALVFEIAIIFTLYLMLAIYNISIPYDKIGVPFLALIMIFSCSFSIYLLSFVDYFVHEEFISILKDSIFIGILPSISTWFFFDKIFYSTYSKKAARINKDLETFNFSKKENMITLIGKNQDNKLEFNAKDLIYIKAEENYCFIFFKKDEKIHRRLFRSTLSALYEQIKDKDPGRNIIRCHRTYIVNLDHVLKMHGNARGYYLQLKNCNNATIPVSRNFPDVFQLKKNYGCKKCKDNKLVMIMI